MNYRVRWRRRALDRLTTLWLEADSTTRQALTAANHAIDTALSQDPYAVGESRTQGRRLAFFGPIGVYFRVEADGRTVSVLQIHVI